MLNIPSQEGIKKSTPSFIHLHTGDNIFLIFNFLPSRPFSSFQFSPFKTISLIFQTVFLILTLPPSRLSAQPLRNKDRTIFHFSVLPFMQDTFFSLIFSTFSCRYRTYYHKGRKIERLSGRGASVPAATLPHAVLITCKQRREFCVCKVAKHTG